MRRLVLALGFSLAACGDLQHENPYDPRSPAQTQARTSFSGTVSLEAVAGVTPPLAGIQVSVAGTSYGAATDDQGRFVISGVPAGSYTIQAVLDGYQTASLTGVTATLDTGGQTVPVPAIALRRVRAPLIGAVTLRLPNDALETTGGASVSLSGNVAGAALTSTTGTYVIPDVPAPIGSYTLTAAKLGYVSQTRTVTYAAGGFVAEPVQLQIDPGGFVGTVVARGAGDSFGVTVRARGTTLGGTPWEDTTTSAADGAFRLSGLPAGTYAVSYERADAVTAFAPGRVVAPGQYTDLGLAEVLPATGGLAGAVVAEGAASSAGTVVEIGGGPDTATAVTDDAGKWAVAALRVGTGYTATYRRAGYTTAVSATFPVARNETTAVGSTLLRVARTAGLTGVATVARPAGAAASAGIHVSLSGTDLNGGAVTGAADTLDGGAYTLQGLPQGTYALTFRKDAYDTRAQTGIALADGAVALVTSVTLPVATGTVAGQVLLTSGPAAGFVQGTDYSGVIVSLTGLEAGIQVPVTITDATGAFRLENVPVHTGHLPYGVTAQKTSYVTATNGSVTVSASSTSPVSPTPLTLPVAVQPVSATVAVNDTGAQTAPANASVTLSLAGTAFNSTAFATSAPNVGGAVSIQGVPPGTYQVSASSASRSCGGATSVTVTAAEPVVLPGTFVCTDAAAPGSVALGVPAGVGADPGFTSSTGVSVPVAVHAFDPSSNVSGYQYFAGGVPSWQGAPITAGPVSPIHFPPGTLAADGTTTLWVRAVDRVGNAGPASSVEIVRDTQPPANVGIHSARAVVNDTSTTALITGGADPSFRSYQACTAFVAPTAPCPSSCALVDVAPSIAVTFDAANRKACVFARAVDRAGNGSAVVSRLELTSDLIPPTGPTFAPLYDPATITVHADYVDFRITGAAKDGPGTGDDWKDIAWVEADTGSGFSAICPDAGCRTTGSFDPCSCTSTCTDPRLVCDAGRFAAIRLPLSAGVANRLAVRAVDVAGNVGSGASQQVLTSGVLQEVSTTPATEHGPRVRGRTLTIALSGSGRIVDLGTNLRWDPDDAATCVVSGLNSYELAIAPIDSSGVAYTTGSSVIVRRRAGTWCPGTEAPPIGTASAGYTINAVSVSHDPANPRSERVVWAENDHGNRRTRLWARDAGAGGRLEGAGAPDPVLIQSSAGLTTRIELGGDALVVRTSPTSLQYIDGTYQVLHRPPGGWGTGSHRPFPATPDATWIAAAVDSKGTTLAWVTGNVGWGSGETVRTFRATAPGADGTFGTGLPASRTFSSSSRYMDLSVEAGHAAATEWQGTPNALTHWAAGVDGRFGTGDDSFARLLPTAAGRALPSLGDGIGGGVVYFAQTAVNGWDILAADLSAFRWDTLSNGGTIYPKSNRAGTSFFQRADGVWARSWDGQETTRNVSAYFYAADGDLFVANTYDVLLHLADASGRFFTPSAPSLTLLAGRAGWGNGGNLTPAAGGGRVLVPTCEDPPAPCSEKSVTLLEPSPTFTTAVTALRVDRPADGAPAGTSVAGDGLGISARHLVYHCSSGTVYAGICVREPGPNGRYDAVTALGYDDVTFLLRSPVSGLPYSSTEGVTLDGDALAFFSLGQVVAVDAGPNGTFNDADDAEMVVGAASDAQSSMLAIAGDFVAWMTLGASGGPEPWVGDVRAGTTRRLASHYSSKYGITVDRSGRVIWEDDVFSTTALFVSAP